MPDVRCCDRFSRPSFLPRLLRLMYVSRPWGPGHSMTFELRVPSCLSGLLLRSHRLRYRMITHGLNCLMVCLVSPRALAYIRKAIGTCIECALSHRRPLSNVLNHRSFNVIIADHRIWWPHLKWDWSTMYYANKSLMTWTVTSSWELAFIWMHIRVFWSQVLPVSHPS